jgi:hypothetical protein
MCTNHIKFNMYMIKFNLKQFGFGFHVSFNTQKLILLFIYNDI